MNATAKTIDLDGCGVAEEKSTQDPGSKTEPGAPSASVQTVMGETLTRTGLPAGSDCG